MRNISILLIIILFFSSCVTKKRFDELLAENIQMEEQIRDLEGRLKKADEQIEELNQDLNALRDENKLSQEALSETTEDLEALQKEHANLQSVYDNLLKNSSNLNRNLAEQQSRLLEMQTDLETARQKNEELAASLSEREQKVAELEKILADQEAAVQRLKNQISDALLNFSDNDLSVEVKNGKVYVSLAEQLLFRSGSIKVDPKGVDALQTLARAIRDQKDINIMVEGHTDDVPISRPSQYMKDNWDLSVMRATSIVKILTESGVDPQQVSASGRGEFVPVADNESAEGRQKNRRTEIIITPDLNELFQILESN